MPNKRLATLNHSFLLFVVSQLRCWQKYLGSSSVATNTILSRSCAYVGLGMLLYSAWHTFGHRLQYGRKANRICGGKNQAGPSGCSGRLDAESSSVHEGKGDYRGLALAMPTMPRWRTLSTVAAFPTEPNVSDGYNVTLPGPLERLEAFKITGICETSAPFNRFLDSIATTSTERLTNIEIATPNALYYLASPNYHSLFRRLRHFKVDVREVRDPADILPCFENLEVLEAYRLRLPTYGHNVDLSIVRTLRRMSIKFVSVQWMSGRTFPSLRIARSSGLIIQRPSVCKEASICLHARSLHMTTT